MKLLLDTHTFLWHADGDPQMSATATALFGAIHGQACQQDDRHRIIAEPLATRGGISSRRTYWAKIRVVHLAGSPLSDGTRSDASSRRWQCPAGCRSASPRPR
jgi:hypothetical protein